MAPDGGSVTLRLSAGLGGVDPIRAAQGAAAESAAAFVREQAEFLDFKPGDDWDTLTVVYFWQ